MFSRMWVGAPFFFFSSRRRHTRWTGDWSSDVCSSDLPRHRRGFRPCARGDPRHFPGLRGCGDAALIADASTAVLPGLIVVLTDESVVGPLRYAALVGRESRKHSVVVLGVLVVRGDDRRGIGVVHDPRAKERVPVPSFAFDDVTDDAAQKGDVRPGAHGGVDVGDGAGASETRIDVDE